MNWNVERRALKFLHFILNNFTGLQKKMKDKTVAVPNSSRDTSIIPWITQVEQSRRKIGGFEGRLQEF